MLGDAERALENAFGLNVGSLASARISPVFGAMISTVPPAARLLDDRIAQLALGDVLQVLVDRQLDRRAGGGWPLETAEGAPARVGLVQQLSERAADLAVVRRLDAGEPFVVGADEAEQLRGKLLLRIEAAIFLDESDALEVELGDARRLRRRDTAAHVDERALLAKARGQFVLLFRRAVGQRFAEHRGRLPGVLDFTRNAINGIGVDAVREHAAVAVEDVAALGGNIHGPRGLVLGARLKILMLVHLQIQQPRLNADGPQHENRGPDEEPAADRGAPVV